MTSVMDRIIMNRLKKKSEYPVNVHMMKQIVFLKFCMFLNK